MPIVLAQIWPCLLAAFGLGGGLALLLRRAFSQFALRTELPDTSRFIGMPALAGLAAKSDLPDLSSFARKVELPKAPDLSGFALKKELPEFFGR